MSDLLQQEMRGRIPGRMIKAMAFCAVCMCGVFSGTPAMAYPTFTCAYEKDHNPPLDAEAERWFQQARIWRKSWGMAGLWRLEKAIERSLEGDA